MRFTSILLFCTVGLLITGGDEADGGGEVSALRMELSAALAKLHSSQLEIDRLNEELDECVQGHLCGLLLFPRDQFFRCLPTTFYFELHRKHPWRSLGKSTDTSTSTATARQAPSPGPVQAGIGIQTGPVW